MKGDKKNSTEPNSGFRVFVIAVVWFCFCTWLASASPGSNKTPLERKSRICLLFKTVSFIPEWSPVFVRQMTQDSTLSVRTPPLFGCLVYDVLGANPGPPACRQSLQSGLQLQPGGKRQELSNFLSFYWKVLCLFFDPCIRGYLKIQDVLNCVPGSEHFIVKL